RSADRAGVQEAPRPVDDLELAHGRDVVEPRRRGGRRLAAAERVAPSRDPAGGDAGDGGSAAALARRTGRVLPAAQGAGIMREAPGWPRAPRRPLVRRVGGAAPAAVLRDRA